MNLESYGLQLKEYSGKQVGCQSGSCGADKEDMHALRVKEHMFFIVNGQACCKWPGWKVQRLRLDVAKSYRALVLAARKAVLLPSMACMCLAH